MVTTRSQSGRNPKDQPEGMRRHIFHSVASVPNVLERIVGLLDDRDAASLRTTSTTMRLAMRDVNARMRDRARTIARSEGPPGPLVATFEAILEMLPPLGSWIAGAPDDGSAEYPSRVESRVRELLGRECVVRRKSEPTDLKIKIGPFKIQCTPRNRPEHGEPDFFFMDNSSKLHGNVLEFGRFRLVLRGFMEIFDDSVLTYRHPAGRFAHAGPTTHNNKLFAEFKNALYDDFEVPPTQIELAADVRDIRYLRRILKARDVEVRLDSVTRSLMSSAAR
jgi:hypothetical protein